MMVGERRGRREHRQGLIGRGLVQEGSGRRGPDGRGQLTEPGTRTSGGVGVGGGLSGAADVGQLHGPRGDAVGVAESTGSIE